MNSEDLDGYNSSCNLVSIRKPLLNSASVSFNCTPRLIVGVIISAAS